MEVSPLPLKKLVSQAAVRGQSFRKMPIALSAQPGKNCVMPWSTEFYQFADSLLCFALRHPDGYRDDTCVIGRWEKKEGTGKNTVRVPSR
jgi:hypothetical protein